MTYQELLELKNKRAMKLQEGQGFLAKKDLEAHKALMGEVAKMNAEIDAAEAQLAEADELLTAVGFVQYLPRRWAKPGCEDKFWQGAAAGMDVLAFGLCACTKLDGMETTNTGDLSVYLAHSADYEQITVSTVPAKKTNNSSKAQLFPVNGKGCAFYSDGWKVLPLSCDREGFCRILVTHPEKDGMIN